jgi:uncharacterized protein (TIGR00156 family)
MSLVIVSKKAGGDPFFVKIGDRLSNRKGPGILFEGVFLEKKSVFLAVFAVFLVVCVGAQEGGYTGPSIGVSGIREAKRMWDESPVVLEGKIERFVGNEKYVLNDGNDTIIVEIDQELWYGLSVGADDVVVVYGEVDKNYGRVEIEVDRVIKKQS